MKIVVDNVKALYKRTEPWGETILDEVVEVLRHSNVILSRDLATKLAVNERDLRGGFRVLTGMGLGDFIVEWRYLQAKDLIAEHTISLEEVARQCGWRSVPVMNKVFVRFSGASASSLVHHHKAEQVRKLERQLSSLRKTQKNL